MQKMVLYLSYVAKAAGFVASLNAIPFIKPEQGILLVLGASLVKDTVNRLADFIDNGKEDGSFQAS